MWWAVALAVVAGLLYAPTGSFAFLRLDDHDYTFRCAFVFDGLSWANVKKALVNVRHAGVWMPITYMSYMADITLFGPGPEPHHLVNVAFHMANVVLLLALAWRLAGGRCNEWIVLAVAFWGLHPQRVEAVAWIASRKELLWAFFALLGLLAHERGLRAPCPSARKLLWQGGSCICCALACMSKPTAMCFPLLALCVDWMRPEANPRNHVKARELCSRAVPYLPFIAMALATGALAIYSQTHPEGHATRELFSASLPWRLLNAAVSIGLSLFQMIVPIGIRLDYRAVPGQFPLQGMLGLTILAGAIGLLAYLQRKCRKNCFAKRGAWIAAAWFLSALLPTLGIFGSFGEHARADRFLYVPMMAVALAAAWTENRPGRMAKVVLGVYVIALAACAWPVIDSYRNDTTVFARTLAFDPENGRALAHVGQAECALPGGIDRGIDHLRHSQAIRPRDDTAAHLAYALAMRGHSHDFAEIRRLCSKFACDHRLDKKGQALEALGMTAMRQRRWEEAIGCFNDSIRAPQRFYSPDDAKLRLAACLCNAGRQEDAIRTLEPLTQSRRIDIKGKANQALETLKRNPRAVLFLD